MVLSASSFPRDAPRALLLLLAVALVLAHVERDAGRPGLDGATRGSGHGIVVGAVTGRFAVQARQAHRVVAPSHGSVEVTRRRGAAVSAVAIHAVHAHRLGAPLIVRRALLQDALLFPALLGDSRVAAPLHRLVHPTIEGLLTVAPLSLPRRRQVYSALEEEEVTEMEGRASYLSRTVYAILTLVVRMTRVVQHALLFFSRHRNDIFEHTLLFFICDLAIADLALFNIVPLILVERILRIETLQAKAFFAGENPAKVKNDGHIHAHVDGEDDVRYLSRGEGKLGAAVRRLRRWVHRGLRRRPPGRLRSGLKVRRVRRLGRRSRPWVARGSRVGVKRRVRHRRRRRPPEAAAAVPAVSAQPTEVLAAARGEARPLRTVADARATAEPFALLRISLGSPPANGPCRHRRRNGMRRRSWN